MTEQPTSMTVRGDQPLIGVLVQENVTRYFTDEKAADAAVPPGASEEALAAIGAWGDLDWDEMFDALDRIRHESKPTPPITDL